MAHARKTWESIISKDHTNSQEISLDRPQAHPPLVEPRCRHSHSRPATKSSCKYESHVRTDDFRVSREYPTKPRPNNLVNRDKRFARMLLDRLSIARATRETCKKRAAKPLFDDPPATNPLGMLWFWVGGVLVVSYWCLGGGLVVSWPCANPKPTHELLKCPPPARSAILSTSLRT